MRARPLVRAARAGAAVALAALVFPGMQAMAQEVPGVGGATPFNLGVPERATPLLILDQERLFQDSLFGQAVLRLFEADSQALAAENRRLEAALEAEERDLTDRRAILPPEEFRALAEAFDIKVNDLRRAQDAKTRALGQRRDDDRRRFIATAGPILAEVMQEVGAVAVVDKSAVILAFDRIDMTDQAIARLDAVLGEGDLTLLPDPASPEPETTPEADPVLPPEPAPAPTP